VGRLKEQSDLLEQSAGQPLARSARFLIVFCWTQLQNTGMLSVEEVDVDEWACQQAETVRRALRGLPHRRGGFL